MIITTASFKGGVGKTTTAIHIAAYLQTKGETLLVDGDPSRSAMRWAKRSEEIPFEVCTEQQAPKYVRKFEHIVIDTQARPQEEDIEELVDSCDLLVLPSTPDVLSLDSLLQTITLLQEFGSEHYKILLTRVPPAPRKDGDDSREMLSEAGFPLFENCIREMLAFQKAALEGKIVKNCSDRRAKTAWNDYFKVCKEIDNGQV